MHPSRLREIVALTVAHVAALTVDHLLVVAVVVRHLVPALALLVVHLAVIAMMTVVVLLLVLFLANAPMVIARLVLVAIAAQAAVVAQLQRKLILTAADLRPLLLVRMKAMLGKTSFFFEQQFGDGPIMEHPEPYLVGNTFD